MFFKSEKLDLAYIQQYYIQNKHFSHRNEGAATYIGQEKDADRILAFAEGVKQGARGRSLTKGLRAFLVGKMWKAEEVDLLDPFLGL